MEFTSRPGVRRALLSSALAVLVGLGTSAAAFATEYGALQADRSSLSFGYRQMGVAMDGQFRKFSAQLSFDPARPAAARATLDIDVASIDAGTPEANDEVAGKLWFNTKAYPGARFVATAFKSTGAQRYEIAGRLTLKGRSQDLVIPASFSAQGTGGLLEGSVVLKRADFGIGEGLWADFGTVANEVTLKFRLALTAGK